MGRRTSRSFLLILELLTSILLFALAGAICIRVLVKADDISRRADALSAGVGYVTSAAELIRSADSENTAITRITDSFPQATGEEEMKIPFPEGLLTITWENTDGITTYFLNWQGMDGPFTLEVAKFYGEVGR